jgi:putative membrane protein
MMGSIVRALVFAALAATISGVLTIKALGQDDTTNSPDTAGKSTTHVTESDQTFLKEAADGGMAEVELGQLATEKASSGEVKKFGQRMVEDHSKANIKLKQLASDKGVELPAAPGAKNGSLKERLSKLAGANFDQAYMSAMVQDHKEDVAAFERESESASDPDIKSFAAETLPTLQEHLKVAQGLAGNNASTASTTEDQ